MAELSKALNHNHQSGQNPDNEDDLDFGRRAVNCKFIMPLQLEEALNLQKELAASGKLKSLETILLETGKINQEQIKKLRKAKDFYEIRKQSLQFGTISIENGFATKDDINRALKEQVEAFQQKMAGRMLGDILVQNGVISAEDKEWILNEQRRLEEKTQKAMVAIANAPKSSNSDLKQQLQSAFNEFRIKERQFAQIAVKNGYAGQEDVDKALVEQMLLFKREQLWKMIGDILIEAEVMQPDDCDSILKSQNRFDETSATKPPERKLSGLEVIISDDCLEVFLHTEDSLPGWVTPKDIKAFLKDKQITYGIVDDAAIEKYLKGIGQTYKFKVAQGRPVDPGRDGEIKFNFKTVADGINSRTLVKAGDIVAEMILMQKGEPGINVFGKAIPVKNNKQVALEHGSGTYLSDDKLNVLASTDGQPKISIEGVVSVFPDQLIDGDLDSKTYDHQYRGNIRVNGIIKDYIEISCGSINVREIREAQIEAIGDVMVEGGIIDARITAQGNIKAKFINNCRIETFGNIIIENEIIDSQIACSDTCKVKRGKILSSVIAAKKGFMVIDIGSPVTEPCEVKIGIDENIDRRVHKLDEVLSALTDDLENLRAEELSLIYDQKQVKNEIAASRQYGDRLAMARKSVKEEILKTKERNKKEQFKRLSDSLIKLNEKFESVKTLLQELSKRQNTIKEKNHVIRQGIEKTKKAITASTRRKETYLAWSQKEESLSVLRAKGQIFEDTILSGEHATLVLTQSYKNVHINEVKRPQTDLEEEAYEIKISHR